MKYLIRTLRALITIVVALFAWDAIIYIGICLMNSRNFGIVMIADVAMTFIITSVIPVKRGWLIGMAFVFIMTILELYFLLLSPLWRDELRVLCVTASTYVNLALELISGAVGGYLGETFRRHFGGDATV